MPLTIASMGLLSTFLWTQPGRHKNSIKCEKLVLYVPELNALQCPGPRVWVTRLVFSPFWNKIRNTGAFYLKKKRYFEDKNQFVTLLLAANVQTRVSFDS